MTDNDEKIVAGIRAAQQNLASDMDFIRKTLADHAELLENLDEFKNYMAGYVEAVSDRLKRVEDRTAYEQ